MIKYVFREDFITIRNASKADPQKIGEALASIAKRNGGLLRPGDVVETARNKRSPLHPHFEWNDRDAAEAYRRDQARELIRVVRVVTEEEQPQRAFLSVSTEEDGVAYHTHAEVLTSRDLQMRVLNQALRDIDAFERRYRDLEEICDMVKVAREKLQARKARMEAQAEARI